MKRYKIVDREFPCGQGWWVWTWDNPQTKKQILEMFWKYANEDGIDLPENEKEFDFCFIQDIWNCEIVEVKGE